MQQFNIIMFNIVMYFICACSESVWAYQAWGTIAGNSTSINLHSIDASTGNVISEKQSGGALAFTSVRDLASDPGRYPTLVWSVRNSGSGNELIAVDPFQQEVVSYVLMGAPTAIESLAIDPTTGIMYGASSSALFTIDPDSGSSSLVGNTSSSISRGMGFDLSGQLYAIEDTNRLVQVDKSDGATTLVGEIGVIRIEDIAAHPETGLMYGLGYDGIYRLFTIDLENGSQDLVGDSLFRPSGLAFTVVPEPTSFHLALFALGSAMKRNRTRFSVCY